jgi:hypothetical protein
VSRKNRSCRRDRDTKAGAKAIRTTTAPITQSAAVEARVDFSTR